MRTRLTELLSIRYPLIQAPMAGVTTPELAAATSNAGALGSLGLAASSATAAEQAMAAVKAQSNQPFNVNFFCHRDGAPDGPREARWLKALEPLFSEFGAEAPAVLKTPFRPLEDDPDMLEAVLAARPPVVSFHLGLPNPETVDKLKAYGAILIASAIDPDDARKAEASGMDAIVAQGYEAGGHRGVFDDAAGDAQLGTCALVPQIADAVRVPVIAGGGIADGRGIAAAFALGASGVQMGTAFLACPEANITERYRATMRTATDGDTRLSKAFSGRPARTRNNRYVEAMARERLPLPDFPTMYGFSGPLEEACAQRGSDDCTFVLYGQAAALNREMPAAELVALLVEEARPLLPPT